MRRRARSRSIRSWRMRSCCSRSSISTTLGGMPRASASPACSRAIRRISTRARCPPPITYVRGDRAAFDAEVKTALGDQSGVRRDLSCRGGALGAQLPVRRGGRARARSDGARSRRTRAAHAELGHAPDAHGRRGAGAPMRSNAPSRSIRTTSVTFNLLALLDKLDNVRRDPRGGHHPEAGSRRSAGDARVRDAAGAGSAEDAVGEVPLHARRDRSWSRSSRARRLRGPHARACPG